MTANTTETAHTCTCTDPAVACPSCLARRDRNGWPKDWQERMREWLRESFCPGCGKAGVIVGLDSVLRETRPTVRPHVCGVGGPGSGEIECAHEWLDRPESDTRECLICGTEVAG
jgi:hypothetical protein